MTNIEVVLDHEAKVHSEKQAGKPSTREKMVEKTKGFVDSLVKESKVRSEQQVAKTRAKKMVIEKKPGCVDSGYDQKLGDDHLGYDTSGLPQLGLQPEARGRPAGLRQV